MVIKWVNVNREGKKREGNTGGEEKGKGVGKKGFEGKRGRI